MNVGIIGAGNVGEALAGASVRAGHSVILSSDVRSETEAAAYMPPEGKDREGSSPSATV